MRAQDFLGRCGVPRRDSFENGAMLADQKIDRRYLRQAQEADTIELGLLALDDRPDFAVADRVGKGWNSVVSIRKDVRVVSRLSLFGDGTFSLRGAEAGNPCSAASRMMPTSSAFLTKRARLIAFSDIRLTKVARCGQTSCATIFCWRPKRTPRERRGRTK